MPSIPPLSIAAGIDYGVPNRIGLLILTLPEEYIISYVRIYTCIIKLRGFKSKEQIPACIGHVVGFLQPESAEILAGEYRFSKLQTESNVFPKVEKLAECMAVAFVQSKQQWEALIPNHFNTINELKIRQDIVYQWLEVLIKEMNPHYVNIDIDDSAEMKEAMVRVREELLNHPILLNTDIAIKMEDIATAIVNDNKNPNEDETIASLGNGTRDLPFVLLDKRDHQRYDDVEAKKRIFKSLHLALQPENAEREWQQQQHTRGTSDVHFKVPVSKTPMNDYLEDDLMLYYAFPFLFPLGQSLMNQGTVTKKNKHGTCSCNSPTTLHDALVSFSFFSTSCNDTQRPALSHRDSKAKRKPWTN